MATAPHTSAVPTPDLTAPLPPTGADDVLTCAACGAANAADSSFCRKCGDALVVTPTADAPVADAAASVNNKRAADVKRVHTSGDETRARHLLDRAFALAERGDMSGAVLACRQSVALAPDVPQGFSMLGLLLERSGDLQGAANAYTRVLHLAPGSRLEEESLARLRASMDAAKSVRRKTASTFNFNDSDLNLNADNTPDDAASTSSAPVVAAAAIAAVSADKHGTRLLTASNGAPAASSVAAATPVAAPTAPLQTAPLPAPPSAAIPAISALDFDVMDEPRPPLWRQIASRPTFYWSGLPLAGAALLGLLVMSWGRSSALSRQVVVPTTTSTTLNEVPKNGSAPASSADVNTGVPDYSVTAPPGAIGGAGPNDSLPFSSAPPTAPANNAPSGANNAASNQNVPAGNASASSAASNNRRANSQTPSAPRYVPSRPQPSFPSPASQMIPPAMPSMLPPVRTQPATQPGSGAITVTPSYGQSSGSNNVASSGGGPLGPGNPKSSGYITLSPRRSPANAAPRPSNNANSAERTAANAGSAGRGNDAIDSINSALQNGGDTGWRYQQRALLFLERGDNQRAADDFQTAIAAYREQVNRGERVSEAKAGIQACQSGLRLALANAR